MVVDPPQHKATIQTEAITGMERGGHRQRLAQGDHKGDTTQKNVQISGIGDAQTWIFIDPGMLKCVSREPASVRLERIKQRGLIPTGRQKRRPIPLATQFLKQDVVNFNKTLAFEKSKWILKLQLEIATALPGVLAGHQTVH